MRSPKYVESTLKELYSELYLKISNHNIHCFLCGAKKQPDDSNSNRGRIKKVLEENYNYKILYAEDLFKNLVHNRSNNNYLDLENILANDSDVVIIVLESVGAFVELGAFVNRTELRDKLIVLMEIKYKNDESFLNQGPIKLLKSNKKNSVLYYSDINDTDTILKLKNVIKEFTRDPLISKHSNDLTSIITLYYFLQYYFGVFSPVEFKEVLYHVQSIIGETYTDLDDRIKSALYLLYNDGLVKKEKERFYVLTQNGYNKLKEIIMNNKFRFKDKCLPDKLRLSILNQKLRLNYSSYCDYYKIS